MDPSDQIGVSGRRRLARPPSWLAGSLLLACAPALWAQEALPADLRHTPFLPDAPVDRDWMGLPPAFLPVGDNVAVPDPVGSAYLTGRYRPADDPRFARVPSRYLNYETTMYLRREALDAFQAMSDAARAQGIRLKIASGTRTYSQQRSMWTAVWQGERKMDGQRVDAGWPPDRKVRWIMQWLAMPATSRHHWGTDVDINHTLPAYFERSPGREEYEWLRRHAADFGFCQTYGPRDTATTPGYREEKWHWTYLPLSRPMLAEYATSVAHADISGFAGAEVVADVGVKAHYVLDIAPACR